MKKIRKKLVFAVRKEVRCRLWDRDSDLFERNSFRMLSVLSPECGLSVVIRLLKVPLGSSTCEKIINNEQTINGGKARPLFPALKVDGTALFIRKLS